MYAALPLFATLALALSAPAHAAPTTAADQKVVLELLQKKAQQIERYVYEDTLTLLKKRCEGSTHKAKCEAVAEYGIELLSSLHSGDGSVSEALRAAAKGAILACTGHAAAAPANNDVALFQEAEAAIEACGLLTAPANLKAKIPVIPRGGLPLRHRAELPIELAKAAARSISTDANNNTQFDKVGLASHLSANWQRRQGVGLYLSMGTGFTDEKFFGLFSDPNLNTKKETTDKEWPQMNITSEKLGAVYRFQPWGGSTNSIKSLRRSDVHGGLAVSGLLYGTVLEKEQLMQPQGGPFGGFSLAGVLDINAGVTWPLKQNSNAEGTWVLQADIPLHEYIQALTGR